MNHRQALEAPPWISHSISRQLLRSNRPACRPPYPSAAKEKEADPAPWRHRPSCHRTTRNFHRRRRRNSEKVSGASPQCRRPIHSGYRSILRVNSKFPAGEPFPFTDPSRAILQKSKPNGATQVKAQNSSSPLRTKKSQIHGLRSRDPERKGYAQETIPEFDESRSSKTLARRFIAKEAQKTKKKTRGGRRMEKPHHTPQKNVDPQEDAPRLHAEG